MDVRQLDISRRTIAVAAALIGTVSLAIGAHAALNMRSLDAAKAVSTDQVCKGGGTMKKFPNLPCQII